MLCFIYLCRVRPFYVVGDTIAKNDTRIGFRRVSSNIKHTLIVFMLTTTQYAPEGSLTVHTLES